MIELNISDMMESGSHFGHQTKRWNPKMGPYLYGARSGVHIIDLQKTKSLATNAIQFIIDAVSSGKNVLYVGTKPQARNIIKEEAIRSNMHYVNQRWMGGTLTNFNTIKKSIDRLIEYTTKRENNDFQGFTKRELLDIDRDITKLEASLGGIKRLKSVPDVVFVVDPRHEKIAVREANKLGIPVLAVVDSNCDPDPIDFLIPANDDAISSIHYFTSKIADACLLGLEKREQLIRQEEMESSKSKKGAKPTHRRVTQDISPDKNANTAYVARDRQPGFEGDVSQGFSAKVEKKEEPKMGIKGDDDTKDLVDTDKRTIVKETLDASEEVKAKAV